MFWEMLPDHHFHYISFYGINIRAGSVGLRGNALYVGYNKAQRDISH
jgi:hypothetical protein